MAYFLTIVFVFYVAFTLNFAIQFNKTDVYFTENQKIVHNVLIWLIPFFWILIIKSFTKPTPGSSKSKKAKPDAGFYESGIGIWGHNEVHHNNEDGGNSNDGSD
jgi:hypothetical protein